MLIEAPELSSFPRIRHAFFTREGGVSEGITRRSTAGSAPRTTRPMSARTAPA
jgi:hypothetical protein